MITPVIVLPDPPESRRPRTKLLLAVVATFLLALAAASVLFTNQLEDGRTLRRAATGELEASGQSEFEFSAPAAEREAPTEDPEELEANVGTTRPSPPPVSAPSQEPATAQRLRGGTERPAGNVDDLGLARREVAELVRTFDRQRTEFESEAAGCRELADAYRALDRAFVRFSTLLAQAGRPPGEADGRLFEIVDQESAAFDRSGCPRPS
jgi:hypothetical protein